ncbi:hypothetical protein ABLN67_05325 [Mycobacterium tuberculosis]
MFNRFIYRREWVFRIYRGCFRVFRAPLTPHRQAPLPRPSEREWA